MAQHLFWGSIKAPPSLRALPLGPRGRAIGMSGPFIGQAQQTLESLSISAIQGRVLATPPLEHFTASRSQGSVRPLFLNRGGPASPRTRQEEEALAGIPTLTDSEKALIMALSMDPSNATLDDLQIIDGFFGLGEKPAAAWIERQPAFTPAFCRTANGRRSSGAASMIHEQLTASTPGHGLFRGTPPQASAGELDAIRSNPFFCGTPAEFPEVVYGLDKADYPGWFGIDQTGTWGSVKQQVENAITVMNVVGSYPFPPPLDLQDKAAFWILSIGEIREIVATPYKVNPEAVRIWITMTILANYSAWVDKIEADSKKKAKKAKRKMIMTMIGLAVASIVAAFLLPAVIAVAATAIKTAITTYVDAQKRRKAAQDMANASKMFADDAPGFSKEVDHAANVLDEQAAAQEAAMAPPPDVQAAIAEVKAETGPAWGTILPVGGGIAAAGLAVFALFK